MEIGNIVLNAVMGTIGNITNQRVQYFVPIYSEVQSVHVLLDRSIDWKNALVTKVHFNVHGKDILGRFIIFFTNQSIANIKEILNNNIEDSSLHC